MWAVSNSAGVPAASTTRGAVDDSSVGGARGEMESGGGRVHVCSWVECHWVNDYPWVGNRKPFSPREFLRAGNRASGAAWRQRAARSEIQRRAEHADDDDHRDHLVVGQLGGALRTGIPNPNAHPAFPRAPAQPRDSQGHPQTGLDVARTAGTMTAVSFVRGGIESTSHVEVPGSIACTPAAVLASPARRLRRNQEKHRLVSTRTCHRNRCPRQRRDHPQDLHDRSRRRSATVLQAKQQSRGIPTTTATSRPITSARGRSRRSAATPRG